MSAETQGGAGRREVAYRLFAAEFDDATLEHSESDEERAPNYVITPTGARVNRLFVVGVLTEVEAVSDDVLRGRVVDPTGAFVVYAGQYQPDAQSFLERADPPMFVAVTGKARTFQPDGSDRILTSIRPESINEVDRATRDRWTVQAAEFTIDRVGIVAAALDRPERGDDLREVLLDAGVEYGLAAGIPLAIEHYGTTAAYLAAVRELAVGATELVAGEREEVPPLDVDPGATGPGSVPPADLDVDESAGTGPADSGPTDAATPEPSAAAEGTTDPGASTTDEPAEATVTAGPDGTEPAADSGGSTASADDGDDAGDSTEYEADADADVDTDELYEFDEGEREAIEEEYGTDFATGNEMDTSDSEPTAPEASDPDSRTATEEAADSAASETTGTGTADEPDTDAEGAQAADLTEVVLEAMEALDEGDGADRTAVIEAATDETDATADAVEDAIKDALMSGRCYEPDDGRLKPI